jgi:hypothetical protein
MRRTCILLVAPLTHANDRFLDLRQELEKDKKTVTVFHSLAGSIAHPEYSTGAIRANLDTGKFIVSQIVAK